MKPHLKTNIGSQRETSISAQFRPSKSSTGGEVSLSFQEELSTTIHGAFEVAVKIAVLEVTKLVGQALGDVREQMHETLRENKSLKQRLQTAEQELDAVRGCVGDGGQSQRQLKTVNESCQQPPTSPLINKNNNLSNTQEQLKDNELIKIKSSLDVAVDKSYQYLIVEAQTSREREHGSFSEICEDGRVCSQELHPVPRGESVPQHDSLKDSKEETDSLYLDEKARVESIKHPSEDRTFGHSDSLNVAESMEVEQIRVKEEKKEAENGCGSSSACSFDSVGENDFGPDSLSLVQSKMLEEWRPDPLDTHNSDSLLPGTSHNLSHPPNINPEASVPTANLPAFSSQFPTLYQPGEASPIAAPPQIYGVQIRTHPNPNVPPSIQVCKICGQAFNQPSELRRHQSQCHPQHQRSKLPTSSNRTTRRQVYPPGRSPYHCSECGRDFNRMENLKTHLRIHTGERPYTCSVCAMRFRHSGALTRHFRIHTGEKPYVCCQCGKTFRNCGGLRFHQRSHSSQGQC